MASNATGSVVPINMDENGLGHKFLKMSHVMDMHYTVYHQNHFGFNAACHVYKTKLPFGSKKVKLSH